MLTFAFSGHCQMLGTVLPLRFSFFLSFSFLKLFVGAEVWLYFKRLDLLMWSLNSQRRGAAQFWLLGEKLAHAKWQGKKGFDFNYHSWTNSPWGWSLTTQRHQQPLLCWGFYKPKPKQNTVSALVWEECPGKLPSFSSQCNNTSFQQDGSMHSSKCNSVSLQQDGSMRLPVWFPHEATSLKVWRWGKGPSQGLRIPLRPQTSF